MQTHHSQAEWKNNKTHYNIQGQHWHLQSPFSSNQNPYCKLYPKLNQVWFFSQNYYQALKSWVFESRQQYPVCFQYKAPLSTVSMGRNQVPNMCWHPKPCPWHFYISRDFRYLLRTYIELHVCFIFKAKVTVWKHCKTLCLLNSCTETLIWTSAALPLFPPCIPELCWQVRDGFRQKFSSLSAVWPSRDKHWASSCTINVPEQTHCRKHLIQQGHNNYQCFGADLFRKKK